MPATTEVMPKHVLPAGQNAYHRLEAALSSSTALYFKPCLISWMLQSGWLPVKELSKEQYSYSYKDLILSTFRKKSISFTLKIILGMTSGKTAISAQQLLIIIIDYYLMTRKSGEREYPWCFKPSGTSQNKFQCWEKITFIICNSSFLMKPDSSRTFIIAIGAEIKLFH